MAIYLKLLNRKADVLHTAFRRGQSLQLLAELVCWTHYPDPKRMSDHGLLACV